MAPQQIEQLLHGFGRALATHSVMHQRQSSAASRSSGDTIYPKKLPVMLSAHPQVLRTRGFDEVQPQPSVRVAAPREVVPDMAALVAAGRSSHHRPAWAAPRRPLAANSNVPQGLSVQARRGHDRHMQHLENKALYEVGADIRMLTG